MDVNVVSVFSCMRVYALSVVDRVIRNKCRVQFDGEVKGTNRNQLQVSPGAGKKVCASCFKLGIHYLEIFAGYSKAINCY